MTRTLRTAFLTGSLALGVLPGLLATATQAQAPLRSVAGSHYYVSSRPAVTRSPANPSASVPAQARTNPSRTNYYYPSQARTSTARTSTSRTSYYYPAPAATTTPMRYYYRAPAPSGTRPNNPQRPSSPRPVPGDDDIYAYKS